jgi:hypothetical protein
LPLGISYANIDFDSRISQADESESTVQTEVCDGFSDFLRSDFDGDGLRLLARQAKDASPREGPTCGDLTYPDGRLEITHAGASLPYRTFDTLRSVHRSEVVENKRLDDMLSIVAELQAGREQQRSKSGPRRTGQTDHMFGIRDGSQSNGYQKRGTKPGR